jgi:hypothetical protein
MEQAGLLERQPGPGAPTPGWPTRTRTRGVHQVRLLANTHQYNTAVTLFPTTMLHVSLFSHNLLKCKIKRMIKKKRVVDPDPDRVRTILPDPDRYQMSQGHISVYDIDEQDNQCGLAQL